MMNPVVSMMNSVERSRQMLAVADRQRRAREVRAEARAAARRGRRAATDGSRLLRHAGLAKVLLRRVS
jgi:hypothetical protein